MAKLTPAQIKQIKQIINDHMGVVMNIMVGDSKPSPRLIKKLGLPKELSDLITDSYRYGKLRILEGKDLTTMSSYEVEALLRKIKLNRAQENAVDYLKVKVQTQLDTLTQRITNTVITSAVQNDVSLWTTVGNVIPKALEEKTPRYKVIQELREYSKDMERDWHRVAHTEMWGAKCMGEVQAILHNESPLSQDGPDTKIYVKPAPNACPKCKQLYLEKNLTTPRVFSITQLLANGNNYGKKQADWLPCIPPLHPNCMCTINTMPNNTKFDDNGNLVLDLK